MRGGVFVEHKDGVTPAMVNARSRFFKEKSKISPSDVRAAEREFRYLYHLGRSDETKTSIELEAEFVTEEEALRTGWIKAEPDVVKPLVKPKSAAPKPTPEPKPPKPAPAPKKKEKNEQAKGTDAFGNEMNLLFM